MKWVLIIIFLISVFLFLSPQQIQAGLVPCGLSQDDPDQEGDQTVPCQFCHFFVLFKNIVDFFLFKIVPPLAALMLAIGGFMYVFAYLSPAEALPGGGKGGPALLSQAKKLLTSVIFGLLIIFAAWIVVNTFFMLIGVATWDGWSLKTDWWKIDCPISACTPNCTGKQCGPDGCGGSCGTCQSGTCNSSGQCVPQLQSCTSMEGTCKPSACNTFTDCASLSGTCTWGYCCSGNCGTLSQNYKLTVSKTGSGSGTVTSNDGKINCGIGCISQSYDYYTSGASVTLSASPAAGSSFTGWSGDCFGTGTCTLTMNADRNVTATFITTITTSGTPWVWGKDVTMGILAGSQRTYIVQVDSSYSKLNLNIYGLSNETNAEFSWTFPDGRVFPTGTTGKADIVGTNSAGRLRLVARRNIYDSRIPLGTHIFTIKAIDSSYMTIRLEGL